MTDPAGLERFLEARSDAVSPIMSVDATLAGLRAEIFGARIGYTYRENWRFLDAVPAVWDEVEAGRAVVINEQQLKRPRRDDDGREAFAAGEPFECLPCNSS